MSGKLIKNALVMYDRETEPLWSQFVGEAVAGPLAGTKLDLVPAQMTTWRDWKTRHPNTLVLDGGSGRPLTGTSSISGTRARVSSAGLMSTTA